MVRLLPYRVMFAVALALLAVSAALLWTARHSESSTTMPGQPSARYNVAPAAAGAGPRLASLVPIAPAAPPVMASHRSMSWCAFYFGWIRDPAGCGMWSGHPVNCDWFARLVRLCR